MTETVGADQDLRWRKSSVSQAIDCVETALATRNVLVRDSKTMDSGCVRVQRTSWTALLVVLRDDANEEQQGISQYRDTNGHNPKNRNEPRAIRHECSIQNLMVDHRPTHAVDGRRWSTLAHRLGGCRRCQPKGATGRRTVTTRTPGSTWRRLGSPRTGEQPCPWGSRPILASTVERGSRRRAALGLAGSPSTGVESRLRRQRPSEGGPRRRQPRTAPGPPGFPVGSGAPGVPRPVSGRTDETAAARAPAGKFGDPGGAMADEREPWWRRANLFVAVRPSSQVCCDFQRPMECAEPVISS
ncbi:DUF397 domain-containing protein [Embleya scabrispora]|uniref:DUF397 domain-containing protein n=1 Tax=Embleya scabrispora TaxID=159449 RepID=UPI00099EDE11|nr:DUF397 domain-containing protein [Embleya scabrispora]MYS80043.1 DUF397 domain-containing protein [Streptomyces sp. SID5474]